MTDKQEQEQPQEDKDRVRIPLDPEEALRGLDSGLTSPRPEGPLSACDTSWRIEPGASVPARGRLEPSPGRLAYEGTLHPRPTDDQSGAIAAPAGAAAVGYPRYQQSCD